MTQNIHNLLHKLTKLNKVRERNSKKFSKVLTQLILEVEVIGKTKTIDEGGSSGYIDKETNSISA